MVLEAHKEILDKLLDSYSVYFDVERMEEEHPYSLAATGYFYSRSEKYVLVKSAQLWAAESYEYLYIFSVPKLDTETYDRCRQFAYEDGMKRIKPHKEHMYSFITAIFLTDEMDEKTKKAVKRTYIHKSFKLSLHGWMEFHADVIIPGEKKVYSNWDGRSTAKFIRKYIFKSYKRSVVQ